MWNFLKAKKNTKTIGIVTLFLILAAVPLTIYLAQHQQNLEQKAAEPCLMSLPTDTMIVFDKSGSMQQATSATDATPKLERAKAAANNFIDLLSNQVVTPKHHIGVSSISTGDTVKLESPLSESYPSIKTAISNMEVAGGTCIECALKIANDEFQAHGRVNIKKVGIVFSDGGATHSIGDTTPNSQLTAEQRKQRAIIAYQKALAEAVKGHTQYGVTYYTIAFGAGQNDNPLMIDIAEQTGGKFIYVPDASQLQSAFEEIAQQVSTGSIGGYKFYDENEDGKYDTEEEKLSNWTIVLKNAAGDQITSTITDTNGRYTFPNLCDGTYKVAEVQQDGWVRTTPATEYTINIKAGSVFESTHFGNVFRGIPPTPTPPICPENATLDTMIVFDKSGSMSDPTSTTDTTPRMTRAKSAATSFIDLLANDNKAQGKHHVGLTAFAAESETALDSPLTEDYLSVKTAINAMPIDTQTCAECGIKIANEELRANSRGGNVKKIAILITDGVTTRYIGAQPPFDANSQKLARQKALDEIKKGHTEQNISYYTIGFGNEVDKTFLQEAATTTGGKYIQVPSAADLQSAFQQIADIAGVSKVTGFKFNDINNNGKFETTEPKLSGWDIILKDANTNSEIASTTTDANGNFAFDNVCVGNYTVSEIQKQGWLKTLPINASYPLTAKGQPITNIIFGNHEAPTPNSFDLTILFDGVGTAGDIQDPTENEFSNKNPLKTSRNVQIDVLNDAGATLSSTTSTVTYDKNSGKFTGTANMSIDFPNGSYFVRIKSDNYLSKKLKDKIQISRTEKNNIPDIILVTGDTNKDNKLNALDYNNILTCYTGLRGKPQACSDTQHQSADINDDGKVNEVDYNLFIREIPAQAGT